MAVGIEKGTEIIGRIITEDESPYPPFLVEDPNEITDIANKLDVFTDEINAIDIDIPQIATRDPIHAATERAKMAYEKTGKPIVVRQRSLQFVDKTARTKYPAPNVETWAETPEVRSSIVKEISEGDENRATSETILAIFDGQKAQIRKGETKGTIAETLRGDQDLGWEDMFEPDGQENLQSYKEKHQFIRGTMDIFRSIGFMRKNFRTLAEMTEEEKYEISAEQKAFNELIDNPFEVGIWVHALNEALTMETDAIQKEYYKGPEMALARKHAFNLRVLGNIQPNEDLEVHKEDLPPYYEVKLHEDITQYTLDPTSNDLGLLITSYDMRSLYDGTPTRLLKNPDGRPTFLQHGEKSLQRALAARAYEFSLHHNPKRYESLREMLAGKKTETRSNKPSPVLEKMLGMIPEGTILTEEDIQSGDIFEVPGFTGLAYTREYSPNSLSRNKGANDHIINRNGIPTSVFALGGMPPVTGSRDVVVTAALSFMRSYVPHNSLFVDFDRRIGLFKESKAEIEKTISDPENEDIKKLAIAQIGICLSGKNITEIQKETNQLLDEGCSSVRIYTTNPGREVTDSAEEICKLAAARKKEGELPFHLCVGPIADIHQAKILQQTAQKYGVALTLLAGHGGGENCTSLEGGAAANAIEIMYQMSLDKDFNDVSLGFEGGLGTWYGPWMGIIDQISKDGSIVRGTVESQGGLCVLHKTKKAVQPYNGTAGPATQMPENTLYPHLAKRTNPAGQLYNNEGRPNYMEASRWAQSITHHFVWFRSLLGRTLADQQSQSIDDIMKKTKEVGFRGHRHASDAAVATAKSHRSV